MSADYALPALVVVVTHARAHFVRIGLDCGEAFFDLVKGVCYLKRQTTEPNSALQENTATSREFSQLVFHEVIWL